MIYFHFLTFGHAPQEQCGTFKITVPYFSTFINTLVTENINE